jgi:hypothetical protein
MSGGRRRSRKMRGGNGYGFGSPIAAGALEVVPNMTSVVDGAAYKPMGGRRRRSRRGGYEVSAPAAEDVVTKDKCSGEGKRWVASGIKAANGESLGYCRRTDEFQYSSKGKHKGGRRTRRKSKGRRRSMRGGGSVAGVGYAFNGSGARGISDAIPYPSNLPPGGAFAIPTGTR